MQAVLRTGIVLALLAATAGSAAAEDSFLSKWRALFSGDDKAADAAPRIVWQVINPFRFFNDARDTERQKRIGK